MQTPAPRVFLASLLLHELEWSAGDGELEFEGATIAIRAEAATKVRRVSEA